jgi:hypothetical protein
MAANVGFETINAIIDVVRNDASCRNHITWKGGSFPWAGRRATRL